MFNRRQFLAGGVLAGAVVLHGAPRPAAASGAAPAPGLEWPQFRAETRPWTRWWWLGSAVTEDGLRRELDALAGSGFGGVEVQPIYEARGDEQAIREYLGPEWLQALDQTVQQATERGLGVDLTTGSGWTFGGPWIPVELSAGRALVQRWSLRGGQRLDEEVRTVHPPHPALVDEELLASPELRPPMPPIPEPPLAALIARETGSGRTLDLTGRVGQDRRLEWTAPPGDWELTGVFSGWVLKRVERAGPGGKGLMADYFDAEAIRRHLDHFGSALGAHGRGVRALFHDSFELEKTDWTHGVLGEFERLRGYPVIPHLPEVFDPEGTSEVRRRVLSDLRETLSDLFLECFAQQWGEWSSARGWLTRNQAHGSPANLLDVYAAADIPETEYTGGDVLPIPGLRAGAGPLHPPKTLVWRMAASAAHLRGGALVGAETLTWRDEHFHVSLSQAKPEVDLLFAAGINHVVFHGTAYSPDEEPWPGLSFYAATELNRNNPWWRHVPELTGYITRCQSVLQDGEHDNDVLVYWPQHDLWATPDGGAAVPEEVELSPDHTWEGDTWMYPHPTGADQVAGGLERRGWQFDWVSDRQLAGFSAQRGGIGNGRSTYAAVVVPGAELVPLETMERLRELAAAGAAVVFTGELPRDVPGLADLDARRARLAEINAELRGRAVRGDAELDRALAAAGAVREPIADSGLSVLRRRHSGGHHYFLANLTGEAVDGWFRLGRRVASVAALDALRDERGLARTRGDEVRVRLAPGESLFLKTFRLAQITAPERRMLLPTGREQEVAGEWELEFLDGGPALPPQHRLDRPGSWTGLGDREAEFSGTARYTVRFALAQDLVARQWVLDLGEVRETAQVLLNGRDLGAVWSIPFQVPLDGALRAGENVLEVRVTNLAANRVRALARRGELAEKVFMQWRTKPPQEWDPQPSGLLGPVRLIEVTG